jgi:hypothetical protein
VGNFIWDRLNRRHEEPTPRVNTGRGDGTTFDNDFYPQLERSSTDPAGVFGKIWSLYLTCPPGKHIMVDRLAVQVIDSNCLLTDLERTFTEALATPPQGPDMDAHSCYWTITQMTGEALIQRGRRDGQQETVERWTPVFRDMLNSCPGLFRIPRMNGYADGTQSP